MTFRPLFALMLVLMVLGANMAMAQEDDLRVADSDWIASPQVAGIVGIPIMPGFAEVDGETIVFDKPGGRIMESRLWGPSTLADVLSWYDIALPANGWAALDPGADGGRRFLRDGEILHLGVLPRDGGADIYLSLAPREDR